MNIQDNNKHHHDTAFTQWRKSSFSNPNGNECIETLYVRRQPLTDLMSIDALYRMILVYLRGALDAHEAGEHLHHIQRTLIAQGDLRDTLPRYLDRNPHTIIALAYFDLDLYEPTPDTLDAIRPCLTKGSVVAFDELAHAFQVDRHEIVSVQAMHRCPRLRHLAPFSKGPAWAWSA